MAFGAVFFSLPVAFVTAACGYVMQGMTAMQTFTAYALVGAIILMTFTFLQGLRSDRMD